MVGNHWEQLVLGLGYHFLSFQPQKRLKNQISRFKFLARHQQKWSKTPFLGYLVPPKGYRGVLHRCMGKVKKFEPSSTLILRRNSHQKKVRAESAPPRTIRVKCQHNFELNNFCPSVLFILYTIYTFLPVQKSFSKIPIIFV